MAYGKKNVVSKNLNNYSLILLGEPGIGKSTTIYQACKKEFGEDGYLLLNMGKEDGVSAIEGVVYEDIEDWKKFDAVVKDIVKNKDSDYPNLKVVILDTLDQCVDICEPACVASWNRDNLGKKDFIPAKTLNSSYGGFGRGEDAVIQMILDQIWKLKKVGVTTWMTGHTKQREILDAVSNQTYTTLSTNIMQKYFNAFKSKVHVVGVALIDRKIETEGTGRKNVVTKKEVTVNKVKEERRKIVFRDDNYSVDSKSRFENIVDEIPLDADELLKALHDAISNSSTPKPSTKKPSKPTSVKAPKSDPLPESYEEDELFEEEVVEEQVEETSQYPSDLLEQVTRLFKEEEDKKLKNEVRLIIKEYGKISSLPDDQLKDIYKKLSK